MTLVQLRVFIAVARLGSFTAAAEALLRSQSSVSEFIRRLEGAYDTALFVRGRRRLTLTDAGAVLLPMAERIVAEADAADRALRAVTSLVGGTASFGLLRNAKYYALDELLTRFHAAHPAVRLRVIGLNSVEVASEVASGGLEAGLVVLPIDTEGLRVTPLRRDEVVFVSRDPSIVDAPMTIEAMAARRLVLYDAHYGWKDPTRRQFAERARLAGVTLEPHVEVEQVETALALVASGVGDTFIARAVAEVSAAALGLHWTPFAEPVLDTVALVERDGSVLSAATAELARLARELLTEG
ncbi:MULTISPECIES: LysR substrate-binding domain-containing protein [Curtobacterium]|uniref:LysR family transcriptional regulator n=1 Tax=Curtobacterium flaccumfaciens TaxID=2035 RepID=UPI003EE436B5